jgi:phosphotransferase system enzyme I (PtsI)
LGGQSSAIFSAHLEMLLDRQLRGELEAMIRDRQYTPEYAVSRALRRYAQVFESLDNRHMAERANDVVDIERRLLRELIGRRHEELSELRAPVVVLARNLTPSETANLNAEFVLGFATETGGSGSHTAIVAQGLEIPAVVGTGPFLSGVSGGDLVIVDGERGVVILQPEEETVARYRAEAEAVRCRAARLETLRDLPAQTSDGVRIELLGNIEFPHEAAHCIERGSDGIGLYRTEFLYLGAQSEPDEEAHLAAYGEVVRQLADKPVVIRTLDLGADKLTDGDDPGAERNPFLGLRSIRLSLQNLPLFRTQLRAILRASTLGDVRVMFPLISTLQELRQARNVLAEVMQDLESRGIAFNPRLPVGMMLEVPAAVMLIERFLSEVDFVSIGTNDLIQYTLAVDRSNKDVAALYTAADPAVLKLLELAVGACIRRGTPVNVCGQMSSNPRYTMLLLGLGLRRLSVTPAAIPEIKKLCRSLSIERCVGVARRALELDSAADIKNYLKDELKKVCPELAG